MRLAEGGGAEWTGDWKERESAASREGAVFTDLHVVVWLVSTIRMSDMERPGRSSMPDYASNGPMILVESRLWLISEFERMAQSAIQKG